MYKTNNSTFDQFLDDEYQSKGYVQAQKVIQKLRTTIFKDLNDKELDDFRKEFAYAFDMTLK